MPRKPKRTVKEIAKTTTDGQVVLSPRYDEIINFVVTNPHFTQKQIAEHFGVSQNWIGLILNTDAAKIRMKEKQDLLFINAAAPLREKLHSLAHQALDKMADRLDEINDPELIREIMESALDRMGFIPAKPGAPAQSPLGLQQNNIYISSPEDLAKARSIMQRVQESRLIESPAEALSHDPPAENP